MATAAAQVVRSTLLRGQRGGFLIWHLYGRDYIKSDFTEGLKVRLHPLRVGVNAVRSCEEGGVVTRVCVCFSQSVSLLCVTPKTSVLSKKFDL